MNNKEDFIKEMDFAMSAKSFEYFFTEILEFEFSNHHMDWLQGLNESRRYCVKASRDHGKSVFFMSYALWLAAFKPNTHIMIFSHSLEQTLEHMRFIRNLIETKDILKDLRPQGRPWNKSYFEFTNKSRLMAKSVGGATRGFQKDAFRVETYPAIKEDGEPLWPTRWPLDALKMRESSMPAIKFAREYLCEPIHDMSSMFPMSLLEQARDESLVLLDRAESEYNEEGGVAGIFGQHFVGWDPAIASDSNADYTAMVTMRMLPDSEEKQIVHYVNERGLGSAAQKKTIILINSRFQPDLIELEGNNFQRMFEAELREMRDDIPIKTFMTTRQRKESMFMSLLLAFEQGKIKTPWGNERSKEFTRKLETQLTRFGMSKKGRLESVGSHGDLAMALALSNWATKEFKGSIVMLDDYLPGFDNWIGDKPISSNNGWFIA